MKIKFTYLMALILTFISTLATQNVAAQNEEKEATATAALNPEKVTIISGFKGGSYYQMALDIQKMSRKTLGTAVMSTETKEIYSLGKDGDTLKDADGNAITKEITSEMPTGDTIDFVKVKDSDGAYYNFSKISNSDVDITFLQYDVLLYEDLKDLKRKTKKTSDVRILLPLGTEEIHLITTKESGIEDFGDLKKKRVGIGSSLQGTNITAKYIKEQTKSTWEDVEIPYDKAFRALFNNDIDAFFFVGKMPIQDLANLPKSMKDKIKLVSLPVNEKLKEAYGEQIEISNTIYSWVDKPVKTYAVKAILVTSILGQTPEQVENIRKVLEVLKANKDNPGYFKGWESVKFEEDPSIEWEYHPMMKSLLK